jgi:hypothetical protein
MLGKSGYTFTATVTEGSPDLFGITLFAPGGKVFFSSQPAPLTQGRLTIMPLKEK